MITNELIEQARNVDLLQYLQYKGYRLNKSSAHEYRLEDHDSLVVSNNRWHWFSRDMGGNTLDFLIKYEGMEFTEAVKALTNHEYTSPLIQPAKYKHNGSVTAYCW
jgi:DNA primase (bacterial type)